MPDALNAGTCMSSLSDNENQFSSSDECDKTLQSRNEPTNVSKFPNCFSNDFEKSLFGDEVDQDSDDGIWPQAKIKAPDRGDPVSESLAKLINDSCSQMCSINDIVAKYKVPSICEYMSAPKVNDKILGDLVHHRTVQTTDMLLRDTQNLVTV